MSDIPMKQSDHPAHNMPDASEQYAGDVIPIRPVGSPANNAGRAGQTRNQGTPSPDTSAPGSNIVRIYG